MNLDFTEEVGYPIADEHMKSCSASLVIRKLETKTMMSYRYTYQSDLNLNDTFQVLLGCGVAATVIHFTRETISCMTTLENYLTNSPKNCIKNV